MKYEYKLLSLGFADEVPEMNSLGRDGWEMCGVHGNSVYFRRPIAEPPTAIKLTPEEGAAITGSGKITLTPNYPLAEWCEVLGYFYDYYLLDADARKYVSMVKLAEMDGRARRLLGR